MTMGERIASMRIRQGLSQTALSQLSNVSQQAISTIESGKRIPNSTTLCLLAAALNTTVSALIGETPPPIDTTSTLWQVTEQTYINQTIGPLSQEEADLIQAFRAADTTARTYALDLLRAHPQHVSKPNRA